MPYNDDHYKKEPDGDYQSQKEIERAYGNKHLEKLSNGCYYDPQTGEEYWPDGTKKSWDLLFLSSRYDNKIIFKTW